MFIFYHLASLSPLKQIKSFLSNILKVFYILDVIHLEDLLSSPFTSRSFFVNLYRITRIIEQTFK